MDIRENVHYGEANWLQPACWLIAASGFVTGSIIFCRSFSDADIAAYLDAQRLLPDSFTDGLAFFLRREAVFLAVIIAMAFFALGWLVVPFALLYRGLGVGIGSCCLIEAYGWQGVPYTLTVLVLPAAVAMFACAIACKNAALLSFGICRYFAGRYEQKNSFVRLILDIPLCAAVIFFSALLSALMRTVMHAALS